MLPNVTPALYAAERVINEGMMPKETPASDKAPYRFLGYVFDAAGVVYAGYRAATPQTCTACKQAIPPNECFTCSEDSEPMHPDELVCVQCRPFTLEYGEPAPLAARVPMRAARALRPGANATNAASELPEGDMPLPLYVYQLLEGVLEEQELQFAALRCGLLDGEERTVLDVGEVLGQSREQVLHTQKRIIRHIKEHCQEHPEGPLALLLADLQKRIQADEDNDFVGEVLWHLVTERFQGNRQLLALIVRILYVRSREKRLLRCYRRERLIRSGTGRGIAKPQPMVSEANVTSAPADTSASDEPFPLRFFQLLEGVVPERDLQIITLRCGLADGEERTLAEVGEVLGVSRERVRQLEERAVKRIQHYCRTSRQEPFTQLLADLRQRIHARGEDAAVGEALWHIAAEDLQGNRQLLTLVLRLLYSNRERERLLELRRRAHLVQLVARSTAAKQEHREAQLAHLWAQVIWPAQLQHTTRELLEGRYPPPSRQDAGGDAFPSAKLERTVVTASPLDLAVLTLLEASDTVVWYQEQPQIGSAAASVLALLADGRQVVIVTAPVMDMVLAANWTRWAALRQWCQEHGTGLLITDGRRAAQELGHHQVNAAFEQELLGALHVGPLTWPAYQEIRDAHGAGFKDFAAVVWRHRLQWERHPFVLRERGR